MDQRPVNKPAPQEFAASSPFEGGIVASILKKMLAIDRLDDCYRALEPHFGNEDIHTRLMEWLGFGIEVSKDTEGRIPKTGPVIVVANHPTGIAEGIALQAWLSSIRPDMKLMANGLLLRYPAFGENIVAVDPFGRSESTKANIRGMKECSRWLKDGGLLIVFPAGTVAHLDARERRVVEGPWSDTIARMALRTGATVVPMHVDGQNGRLFHMAGILSPRLRTALLPRELLKKRGTKLQVRIGRPIPAARLERLGSPDKIITYLRHRTFKLAAPPAAKPKRRKPSEPQSFLGDLPVMAPADPVAVRSELERVRAETQLDSLGKLSVHVASASQAPLLLTEIGRLREETFRFVGEGTGAECDIDRYDSEYLHLFVWDDETGEIAGAYRMRPTHEDGRPNAKGLYTSRLFGYGDEFLEHVGPGIELGRSFVRPEYQADFGSLYLLWKGVGGYLARHPDLRSLIGAVSMSARYRGESRELLVSYLEKHVDPELERHVTPPHPFRHGRRDDWSPRELGHLAEDIRELTSMIEDIEPDGEGVPVLWRHYLKLGARVAAFNVDPSFSNVVDGMIVVNLDQTPMRILERYMGSECAKVFRGRQSKTRSTC